MSLKQFIAHLNEGVKLSGKKSLFQYLTSWEFGKMIQDGNLMHGTMFKGPSGKTVGTDYHGNVYREDNTLGYTRKRWVVFADKYNYDSQSVPAEWHGWLNYINDQAPSQEPFEKPIYAVPARVPQSGVAGKMYQPKGSWLNPQKRNWHKYETWAPTQTAIENTRQQNRLAAGGPDAAPPA